jgi:hypothetical protein
MVIQGLQDQRQIQQQNIQEGKMKLQQAQQAAQDEQTYRQMAMQGSVSPEMLESKGLYKQASALRQEMLKTKKEQTDIDKSLMGMSKDRLDILDKQTKAAQEVGVALDSIQDPAEQMKAWQTVGYPRLKAAGVEGIDPNTLPATATRKMYLAQATSVQEALERVKAKYSSKLETAQEGFVKFDPATQSLVKVPGATPRPQQAMIAMGGGGLTPEAMDMLVNKYRQTGVLDADVGRNPALRTKIINAAASKGEVDLAGAKTTFKNKQEATKYFTTGKGADAGRQQETILHHAEAFQQMASALDNGNVQAANKFANQLGIQLGKDKARNIELAGQILSAEVGKYLSGGTGTEAERAEMSKMLPMFSSPQQFRGALNTLSTMVQGQRQSWVKQRNDALSGRVPFTESQSPQSAGHKKSYSTDDLLKLFGK